MGLKTSVRRALRLKEIASVFLEMELHYLIDVFSLKYHLPWHQRIHTKTTSNIPHTHPDTVRQIFERLGGAFLKLGQILAIRPDLVGASYSDAFAKLLEHVEPLEFEEVKSCISECLPHGISTFKKIDKKAIASGSIAQVHKAVLPDGTVVAVKIRRPNIEKQFESDISILYSFTKLLSTRYNLEFMDPEKIIDEFQNYTLKELDLNHEARNIARFTKNFEGDPHVHIPKIYPEISSDRILVMEYIEGQHLLQDRKKSLNTEIVDKLTAAVYQQLFDNGFFHADLHPGNIFVLEKTHSNHSKRSKKSSHQKSASYKRSKLKHDTGLQIAFLDFGIVGYIDTVLKREMADLFIALIDGDLEKTAKALIELNTARSNPNVRELETGIYHSIGEYYGLSMDQIPIAKMLNKAIDVARKNQIALPAQMVLFSKSLLTLEGSCRELDPEYNIVESAKPFVRRMLTPSLNLNELPRKTAIVIREVQKMFSSVPSAVSGLERKLSLLEFRIGEIDTTFHYLSHVVWRISKLGIYSVLFASFLISASILIHTGPMYNNLSYYTIISGGLALVLLFLILLNLRDNTDLKRGE